MARSKSRRISRLLIGNTDTVRTETVDSDTLVDIASRGDSVSGVTTLIYDNVDDLPNSANNGDQAFVTSTNNLYMFTGNGWFRQALINLTPYWITEPASSYTLDRGNVDSDFVLVIEAGDSDGTNVTYTATLDSDVNVFTDVSKDSDNGRIFNIGLKEGFDSDNDQSGIITFKASDGISFASKAVTINFRTNITRFLNPSADGTEWGNATLVLNDAYNNGGGTWTANYDAGAARWQQDNGNFFDGVYYAQALDVSSDDDYLCVMYFDNFTQDFNNRGSGYMMLQRSDATLSSGDINNQAGNYLRYWGGFSFNGSGPAGAEGTDSPGLVSATLDNTGISEGESNWYVAVRRQGNKLRGWTYWDGSWRLHFDTDGAANGNVGYISATTGVRQTTSPQPRVQLVDASTYANTLTI